MRKLAVNTNFEVKSIDESKAYIEGYASVYNVVDYYGDAVVKGAFRKSVQEFNAGLKRLPMLYEHEEPIGKIVLLSEDEVGLKVGAEIIRGLPESEKAIKLLSAGVVNGLSIGYSVNEYDIVDGVRYLKNVDLWEISIVTFPANKHSTVQTVLVKKVVPFANLPLADKDTPWDASKSRERVAKWSSKDGSGDKDTIDWSKYRKAFLWYDEENPENFTSYKFPIGDIIDGELKAVPRAIFTASAVLQGARGGTNLPDEDIEAMKRHLEKYYELMDMLPPWKRDEEKSFEDAIEQAGYLLLSTMDLESYGVKAGRVLNQRNAEVLKTVLKVLSTLLKIAGVEIEDEGTGQEQADKVDDLTKQLTELLESLKQGA